jgi:hypothetical protein
MAERRAVGFHVQSTGSGHIDWRIFRSLIIRVGLEGERRNPMILLEIDLSAMHRAQSPSPVILANPEANRVLGGFVEKHCNSTALANDCTQ